MELRSIHIHNFRGILDQSISLKKFSLLIGPNNSGKSTVIDAIRAFYEKDGFRFACERDFPKGSTSDRDSWVELTYTLSEEEWESLASAYKRTPSRELRLRKYFIYEGSAKTDKAGRIFGYKADHSLADEPFYGARNIQCGKLGDLVYIPAISKVDEHTKLSGPSALRDLLNEIMSNVVQKENTGVYEKFGKAIQEFSSSIHRETTTDGRSLEGFEQELNSLLKPWNVEFKLDVRLLQPSEITKTLVEWTLVDGMHGVSQEIETYGSGFQRFFIYSLVRLGSQYTGIKPKSKTKDFVPSLTLVLFEEPEVYLHPPQQQELARSLRDLTGTTNWQVICATHSAHFVSRNTNDISSLISLRRAKREIKVFQIGDRDWSSLVSNNNEIHKILGRSRTHESRTRSEGTDSEIESFRYFIWLNPDRTSAFFADHVLLVEGPTEVALINRLIDERKIRAPRGVYVMDCMGKYNIHRFMNLFGRLGIPHSVLYDDDANRNEHRKLNELIRRSRHPHMTLEVEAIPGDLEKMLGVRLSGRRDLKPQEVLHCYERGNIDQEKLGAFCKTVERCLRSDIVSSALKEDGR